MKKHLILSLLLSITLPAMAVRRIKKCDSSCKATSKTFFSIRPPHQIGSPERLVHFRDKLEQREDGWAGTIQATVFGGKSTRTQRLAQYFMPECRDKLIVREQLQTFDQEKNDPQLDILANHLNIYTANGNFESEIRFEPEHSFIGVGFNWKQRLYERDNGKHFFGFASLPIVRVKNKINLCERIIEDGGGINETLSAASETINNFPVVANVKQAFRQKAWKCGKIDDCGCDKTETRVADIEVGLGYQLINEEMCTLESFVGGIIATGNRPEGTYVFEPIVGHNKHHGVFWGSSIGLELWHHDNMDRKLMMYVDYNGRYMFERSECRLVDVKCKPWSRYMQLYCNLEQATAASTANENEALVSHTPGVNKFCLCLDVSPRFIHTFNTGFSYYGERFEAELGYNFFCRSSECIELGCTFAETAAFKSVATGGAGQTDNVQTICRIFNNVNVELIENFNDNIIKTADLDLESAAHPGTTLHTIYGSFGYRWDDREYPIFAGLGGSYQYSQDNTGMSKWMLWGKAGISF